MRLEFLREEQLLNRGLSLVAPMYRKRLLVALHHFKKAFRRVDPVLRFDERSEAYSASGAPLC